jgi:hypothetical protein
MEAFSSVVGDVKPPHSIQLVDEAKLDYAIYGPKNSRPPCQVSRRLKNSDVPPPPALASGRKDNRPFYSRF